MVDIRWVDVHRVSAYLSKYLTKEALGELPDGVRRFSCSRGLVLWVRQPATGKWVLLRLPMDLFYTRATAPAGEVSGNLARGRFRYLPMTPGRMEFAIDEVQPDGKTVLAAFLLQ